MFADLTGVVELDVVFLKSLQDHKPSDGNRSLPLQSSLFFVAAAIGLPFLSLLIFNAGSGGRPCLVDPMGAFGNLSSEACVDIGFVVGVLGAVPW